jgi:hypothetical protein
MLRTLKWLASLTVAAIALVLAAVVFGGRDPDWNGTVVLRWDPERRALEWMQRPRMARDGPYVFCEAHGYTVVETMPSDTGWRLQTGRLPAHPLPVITVRVGDVADTRFDVPLRPAARAQRADEPGNPPKLLMLSDMEGQFDRFVALLRAQGVIDAGLHWAYGRNHIALVGDLVDRGEQVVPLLWLVYRLEGEAERAGGRVHYVLGNHEQMALAGNMESWPERMRATAQALDGGSKRMFSDASVLGQWLRSKPVIARVGDHLLVHGGISAGFLRTDLTVDAANALARPHLHSHRVLMPARVQAVLGRSGVTRYRGLAKPDARIEEDPVAHLRQVAQRYGVRRVAIGHTIAPDIALQHHGLLLRLDVHHKTQVPQAALYAGGRLWRVYADGRPPVRLDCGVNEGIDDGTGEPADCAVDRRG